MKRTGEKTRKDTSVRIESAISTWKLESNCFIHVCLYSTGSEALNPWEYKSVYVKFFRDFLVIPVYIGPSKIVGDNKNNIWLILITLLRI